MKLIIGDCFEILKTFPDKSVHACLTSPPFKDEDVEGDYYGWYGNLIDHLTRVTRDYILIFNSSTRLVDLCDIAVVPDRILIWNKHAKSMQYAYRWEPILVYEMVTATYKINKYIWSDVLTFAPVLNGIHPYENPVPLYVQLLSYLKKSQIILDPFAGSGTTALACRVLNKEAILIEKKEEYESLIQKNFNQPLLLRDTIPEVL